VDDEDEALGLVVFVFEQHRGIRNAPAATIILTD
jgi:hypothetical protein